MSASCPQVHFSLLSRLRNGLTSLRREVSGAGDGSRSYPQTLSGDRVGAGIVLSCAAMHSPTHRNLHLLLLLNKNVFQIAKETRELYESRVS